MKRIFLMSLMGLMALVSTAALLVAFTSGEPAEQASASADAPLPRIVIGAETMADVLAALDLEPVEIVHE